MTLVEKVDEARRCEAARIEEECAKYIGTGFDLGVSRDVSFREAPDGGVEMVATLKFFPVRPGEMPRAACAVYRVSSLGLFASA